MKLLIPLVLARTVQGEVFEPQSESSSTPEIAEKSAGGEDEENHVHDDGKRWWSADSWLMKN